MRWKVENEKGALLKVLRVYKVHIAFIQVYICTLLPISELVLSIERWILIHLHNYDNHNKRATMLFNSYKKIYTVIFNSI